MLGTPDSPDECHGTDADRAPEKAADRVLLDDNFDVGQGFDRRFIVWQNQPDDQQADHVHHFDERIDRWPGGIFERIAHGVAGDGSLVLFRAFACSFSARLIFDRLLGVIPRAAGIRHEDGQELTCHDHARQEPCQTDGAQRESDENWHKQCQQAWTDEFFLSFTRANVHHAAVIGLWSSQISLSRNWMRHSFTIK